MTMTQQVPPPGSVPCPNFLKRVNGRTRRMCIGGKRWRDETTGRYMRDPEGEGTTLLALQCIVCKGRGWVTDYPQDYPELSNDWSKARKKLTSNTRRRWQKKKARRCSEAGLRRDSFDSSGSWSRTPEFFVHEPV